MFGSGEGCQDSPVRMWVMSEAWQMEGAVGGKARLGLGLRTSKTD